nr:ZAR1-like protein [Cavia porcellus]
MERFVRVPCVWYQDCGNTLPVGQSRLSRHCQPTWRQNMGPPTFLARPGLLVPANAPEYWVNPYRRAHFEPILTPMNPNLCQRLCKANTKEVGVQVSLRVDKAIQCSLGPQTLHSCCPWDNASHRKAMPHWGVYSQLIGRRGYAWLRKDEENGKSKVLLGPGKASQQPPPMPVSEDEKQDELPRSQELVEEDAKHLGEGKDISTIWSFRIQTILCFLKTCSKSQCSCLQKKRRNDRRRPHRQELCGRCKDKKFSCGSIYNSKYII